jgi:hypothetical protein
MKSVKSAMLLFVAAVVAMSFFAVNAHAQSGGVKVTIPFPFHVGKALLPAGNYVMRMEGELFRISDGAGHAAFVISNATPNRDAAAHSRLVFKGYGDAWILTQVRWQGYNLGRDMIPPTLTDLEARKLTEERTVAIVSR